MKDLGERPPCPECGSSHVKSTGISWTCCNCAKTWQKIHRNPRKLISRPEHPCPKCGSTHVYDVGMDWRCADCGKWWLKNRNPRKLIERPEHPCPICNSIRVYDSGKNWQCGDCGKVWAKHLQRISFTHIQPNVPIKVEEVKTIEN